MSVAHTQKSHKPDLRQNASFYYYNTKMAKRENLISEAYLKTKNDILGEYMRRYKSTNSDIQPTPIHSTELDSRSGLTINS